MLKDFDDAMRSAAAAVSDVDRDVRKKLVRVSGREERYTEKFITLLEERLDGFSEGGLTWSVSTHVSDKQSGEERDTGADMFISVEMNFRSISVQKGIQVQAKINKNSRFGLRVDSRARLVRQCQRMLARSEDSFVFAYGDHETKILPARLAVDARGISETHLMTDRPDQFFYDFFRCRHGDRRLYAQDNAALQTLVKEMRYRAAARLVVSETEVG